MLIFEVSVIEEPVESLSLSDWVLLVEVDVLD
jgi:hypothetical protein